MAAPKIRSDYDQLNQIGQRFGQEGESTRQLIQSLRQNVDTLRGGDWIGPGATAFYAEMDGSVMPSLKRLAVAMDAAKQASSQVRQLMQQAEGEASGQLRRDQTGGGGGGAAGGGGGSGAGGAGGGGGSGGAGGAGGGMPDPSQLFNNLDGGDSGGSAGGGGGDMPDGVPTNPGAAFDILDGNDPNYEYGTGQGSGDLPDGVPTNPEAAFDRLDSDADPNYQYGQSGQQGSQSDAFTPIGQQDAGSGAGGQSGGGGSQSGGGSPSGGGSSGGGSPSGGGGSPPPTPPPLDEKNKKLLKALKKILSKMGDNVDEAQIPAEMKGLFKDFAALKDLVGDD